MLIMCEFVVNCSVRGFAFGPPEDDLAPKAGAAKRGERPDNARGILPLRDKKTDSHKEQGDEESNSRSCDDPDCWRK